MGFIRRRGGRGGAPCCADIFGRLARSPHEPVSEWMTAQAIPFPQNHPVQNRTPPLPSGGICASRKCKSILLGTGPGRLVARRYSDAPGADDLLARHLLSRRAPSCLAPCLLMLSCICWPGWAGRRRSGSRLRERGRRPNRACHGDHGFVEQSCSPLGCS